MNDEVRRFDLNIERVLEHWAVAHALREVIANALDEQALTGSAEPAIFKDSQGAWHIKDSGRGLYCLEVATTQRYSRAGYQRFRRIPGRMGSQF